LTMAKKQPKPKPEPASVLLVSSHVDGVEDELMETCPNCDYRGDIQTFDVGGLDEGHLWCNQCHKEFISHD